MEPTALNGDQAGLVVVIHAPTAPGPVVVHSSGGRIDWYLEVNAITECPFELTAQLRRHVIRLLGDLGIPQMHHEVSARHLADPSEALDLPIPVWLRTSPMELASGSLRLRHDWAKDPKRGVI